jgi:hypothetical protein
LTTFEQKGGVVEFGNEKINISYLDAIGESTRSRELLHRMRSDIKFLDALIIRGDEIDISEGVNMLSLNPNPNDFTNATEYFHQASSNGSVEASWIYAYLLYAGIGCNANIEKGMELIKEMSSLNDDANWMRFLMTRDPPICTKLVTLGYIHAIWHVSKCETNPIKKAAMRSIVLDSNECFYALKYLKHIEKHKLQEPKEFMTRLYKIVEDDQWSTMSVIQLIVETRSLRYKNIGK